MIETIRQFLVRNRAISGIEEFGEQDSLVARGLIDSGTMVEMILFLESEFDITVDDHDVTPENMDSLSALVTFIASKQCKPLASHAC